MIETMSVTMTEAQIDSDMFQSYDLELTFKVKIFHGNTTAECFNHSVNRGYQIALLHMGC